MPYIYCTPQNAFSVHADLPSPRLTLIMQPMILEDQQQILSGGGGGKKSTCYKFCRFAVIFASFYTNLVLLGKLYSISLLVNELLKPPCFAGGDDDGINTTTKLTTDNETVKPTGSEGNYTRGCGGFGAGRGPTGKFSYLMNKTNYSVLTQTVFFIPAHSINN